MSINADEVDGATGLPKIADEEAAKKAGMKGMCITWIIQHVFMAVGVGIAVLIYKFTGQETYDKKIGAGAAAELGWPCLSIFIFGYCTVWLNIFPLYYKEQMMPKSGNIRANQFLYR